MKRNLFLITFLFVASCSLCQTESIDNPEISGIIEDFQDKIIEIPYIEHTNLAGDFNQISEYGASFKLFSNVYGQTQAENDFYANFKLAWNKEYILVQVKVKDDIHYIHPSNWRLWFGDALAVFIGKDIENSRNFVQELYVYDEKKTGNIKTYAYDFRKKNSYKNKVNILSSAYKKDSCIFYEIAFPFQNFEKEAQLNDLYNFQLVAYDYDVKSDTNSFTYPFVNILGISYNPWAAKKIKLVEKTTQQNDITVRAFWIDNDSIQFILFGDEKYNGKKITLRDKKIIYFDKIIQKNDSSLFTHTIAMPKIDKTFKTPALFIDGEFIETVDLSLLPIKRIRTKPIRFEDVIRVFEKKDRLNPPSDSLVLFLGSSTITKWESLESDFKEINALNRAFGGSIAQDINTHLERLVFPYNPYKIVYYEGDNDISFKMTPQAFVDTCKVFVAKVHAKLPKTEIVFLSIKPSPARKALWKTMQTANALLKKYAESTPNVRYIDMTSCMFDEKGVLLDTIWENDKLHMNEKGYELWRKVLKEKL